MSWWNRWVKLWDTYEHPRVLALFRILLAAVILYDFLYIWQLDLVMPLFATEALGGFTDPLKHSFPPHFYQWFPATEWTARGLHLTIVLSATSLLFGFFTRTSALILMLAWAQHALIAPMSDRGIDMLCRNLLFLLMFSPAGKVWSADAVWETGRLGGDGRHHPAWVRHLVIVQVLAMYFTAGVQKGGLGWLPMGHFSALYTITQDWGVTRGNWSWLANQPWFFFTQVSTAVTMVWEISTPIMALFYWYRATPERPGRLRAWTNRYHLHLWWLSVGVIFHLGIHILLDLGIFPWAMLATYVCFLHPDELAAVFESVKTRVKRIAASPSSMG